MEVCYACGASAEEMPYVGVMNKNDAEGTEAIIANPNTESAFVGVRVCEACHKDPEHRTRPLKCHFFPRGAKGLVGLVLAGSAELQH